MAVIASLKDTFTAVFGGRWDHNSFNLPAQRKRGFIPEVFFFLHFRYQCRQSEAWTCDWTRFQQRHVVLIHEEKKSSFHLNTNTGRSKVRLRSVLRTNPNQHYWVLKMYNLSIMYYCYWYHLLPAAYNKACEITLTL